MRKLIHTLVAVLCLMLLSGCNDWLDVQPKDKTLEGQQFSTEEGIQSVLNGFYKRMSDESLYGGNLSQLTIECLANRYAYDEKRVSNDERAIVIQYLSKFDYEKSEVKSKFKAVWTDAYNLVFRINNYLKGIEESLANVSEARKNILLGEAYGLRAYIHFDLFRIFGPIYSDATTGEETIPYNTLNPGSDNFETELLTSLGKEKAADFMTKLLKDIETAETYLKNDPIVNNFERALTTTLVDDFYLNRNRRMNYYAVQALKARVYQYMGEHTKAAETAEPLLDVFNWTTFSTVSTNTDYTLFNEVIFGISNLDQVKRAKDYYQTERFDHCYLECDLLFKKIYDLDGDGRINLWDNTVTGLVFPVGNTVGKFLRWTKTESSTVAAGVKFQPLVRLSEMLFIVIEDKLEDGLFTDAVQLLNDHLQRREVKLSDRLGNPNNPVDVTDYDELINFLRKEYYREFSNEGQIFFFNKRRQFTDRFDPATGDIKTVDKTLEEIYVVPVPIEESNI